MRLFLLITLLTAFAACTRPSPHPTPADTALGNSAGPLLPADTMALPHGQDRAAVPAESTATDPSTDAASATPPEEGQPENPVTRLLDELAGSAARFQGSVDRQTAALREALAPSRVLVAAALLVLAYLLIRLAGLALDRMAGARASWAGPLRRVAPFARFCLWGLALWTVGGYLFGASSLLVTFLVILTLGVSIYAALPLLRDVLSGAVILGDGAFEVGSKLEVDGRVGKVVRIGLRSIRLSLNDGALLVLPNAHLLRHAVVSTPPQASAKRVEVVLPLPPSGSLSATVTAAHDAAVASTFAASGYPAEVHLTADALVVIAYAYDARYAEAFVGDLHRLVRLA